MTKRIVFLSFFAFALSLQSFAQQTINPSGNVISKDYSVSSFDGVEISTDFHAFITFGNETAVRIEADDNMHEHLTVAVSEGHLTVRHKSGMNIRGKETLIAHITVPSLDYIQGSADAVIVLKNELKADELKVELRGDSTLDGDIVAGNMHVDLRGDSYLTISGRANKLEAHLRGDSEIKDFDFTVGELDLDLAGDSIAELTVENHMDVNINGDSEMRYKGNPKTGRQIVRGDSELHKVN